MGTREKQDSKTGTANSYGRWEKGLRRNEIRGDKKKKRGEGEGYFFFY